MRRSDFELHHRAIRLNDEIPRLPHAFPYELARVAIKRRSLYVQTTRKMKMLMLRTLARALQSSRRSNVWRTYGQLRNSSSIAPVNGTNGTGVSISAAEVYQGRSWMPSASRTILSLGILGYFNTCM